jgi:pimeloyl-ACP methyl ester carboxylesterase
MKPDYEIHGAGAPFLYVPGIEGTGKLFYKQIEDLARDHTIITMRLRPEGSYGMEELIDDLKRVISDAGFERATVLGESFGGLLTMAAALAHPNIFERIILVNTFPFFAERARIRFGVAVYSLLPYRLIKAYRSRAARRQLFSDDISEEDRHIFRERTRIVPREGYRSRLRIIRDTDLRSRLCEIKIPTLVVAGTNDRLINSLATAREMVALLPCAKLKILDGTGHTALLSNRVRVREWLEEMDDL